MREDFLLLLEIQPGDPGLRFELVLFIRRDQLLVEQLLIALDLALAERLLGGLEVDRRGLDPGVQSRDDIAFGYDGTPIDNHLGQRPLHGTAYTGNQVRLHEALHLVRQALACIAALRCHRARENKGNPGRQLERRRHIGGQTCGDEPRDQAGCNDWVSKCRHRFESL